MGKLKEKVEKRQIISGKKGILLLNIFSRLVVGLGLIALVCSIVGTTVGILKLQDADTKYMELIESEDFEFSLSSIGFTKGEFIEYIEEDDTVDAVLADYVVCGIAFVMDLLILLAVYMCAWVVTGSIKQDEDKPFKKENLGALKKTATVLLVLYVLQILFGIMFGTVVTDISYLFVVSVFLYLFDAGYKLQIEK